MPQLFLINEGTTAVGVMAVAMAIAFLGVVGLGAYVLYCDAQNRAGEGALVPAAGDGHGGPVESHAHPAEPPAEPVAEEPAAKPARRRTRPPAAR